MRATCRQRARARTSSSALAGRRSSTARASRGSGSIPNEARTSPAHVSGDAPSLSRAFVRPPRAGRDLPRHGEHLPPLVERKVGRDQRTAPLARLDDDRRRAEAGDDAVARREAPRRRRDARRVLRDDQACVGDAARELRVRGRVVAIDAAAEHGDGRALGLERTAVGLGVDAAREAADDDEPGSARAPARDSARRRAVARAGARTDDRDGRPREQLELGIAAYEQAGRWIVNRAQERREARRRPRDEPISSPREPARTPARRSARMRRQPGSARRPDQMRARLGREDREGELVHCASSCGER